MCGPYLVASGNEAKAALMTRGMGKITRLGVEMGVIPTPSYG